MKKSKIALAVIFWFFVISVMALIFRFSCDTGEESAEVSTSLLSIIIEFIGNYISHNFLRKLAHFSEFAALGFFMSGAIYFTFNKKNFYIPLIPCALYAVSDEIHQYFVPERACRILDVFIDSCGSLIGIIIFLLIVFIVEKSINRRNKNEKKN